MPNQTLTQSYGDKTTNCHLSRVSMFSSESLTFWGTLLYFLANYSFKQTHCLDVACQMPHWIFAFLLQMHASMVPGSPILSRQPLTPRQHYNQVYAVINQTCSDTLKPMAKVFTKNLVNLVCRDLWCYFVLNQTGGFMFPINRPCPSTPQSLTPKMMQLRFGANSPRPSPFYSPSSNSVQHFRCVTISCIAQQCLICRPEVFVNRVWVSSIFMTWKSCSSLTSVYKTLFIDLTFINFIQSLALCVFTRKEWLVHSRT